MNSKLGAAVVAIPLLVAFAPAAAQEARRECLPADLRLRVAFAEPKQLADALREIGGERKRAGLRAVLKRRFAEVGCARIDEQTGAGFSEPNLICRIPGKRDDTIAIGSSPMLDGWAATALLPEIARAVAAAPREHGYAIALLSRSVVTTPAGARAFADSFGDRRPRVFVHIGTLGSQLPQIGPEAGDEQACIVRAIARAVAGAKLSRVSGWGEIQTACLKEGGRGPGGIGVRSSPQLDTCSAPFGSSLDTDPFVRAGVPVAGLYAFPKGDAASFSMQSTPRLDAAAYVASYRVLAAYAVALDALPDPAD